MPSFKVGDLIKPTGNGDDRAINTQLTGSNVTLVEEKLADAVTISAGGTNNFTLDMKEYTEYHLYITTDVSNLYMIQDVGRFNNNDMIQSNTQRRSILATNETRKITPKVKKESDEQRVFVRNLSNDEMTFNIWVYKYV